MNISDSMFDPKDSKTIGYHLFLVPTGELFELLQKTINTLAEHYHGPVFDPHVTLLARIPKADEAELIGKSQRLADTMRPFELQLTQIGALDAYFRALFWKAEPNEAIQEYHQKALDLFGVEDANAYMPHASLYYGNISQSEKEEMIASLSLPASATFSVNALHLYRTDGEAQDWVKVGTYTFD